MRTAIAARREGCCRAEPLGRRLAVKWVADPAI